MAFLEQFPVGTNKVGRQPCLVADEQGYREIFAALFY